MLITAKNLSKEYKMSKRNIVHALNGVDLAVEEGEFIAIVGPSGSGKSTILNLLGTLDRATGGSLVIDGQDLALIRQKDLPEIRAEKIGFIFQEFNLVPTLSALENVMLGLRYVKGVNRREARRRSLEYLELVGLADRVRHRPTELSGGEQQRVAIARALAKKPKFILGDEPTGELDTANTQEIVDLLRRINKDENVTMILVTHNLEVADQADRVVYVRDGKIVTA